MFIVQLSIFVENQPGRLAEITAVLAREKIDIRALSIADTTDFGILRLIVCDPQRAETVLREAGFTVSLTQVIAIGIEDKPGGLAQALQVLYAAKITVEYMYAFVSRELGRASVILRVDDGEKALTALAAGSVKTLTSEEIYSV